jgi:hypothetical protein
VTETVRVADSQEDIDDLFEENGWSDGLPIVAPTRERVDRMLAWTDREPDHSLGAMPPRRGVTTVEALAINAVMAGCRPSYFPLVITAVEAMLDPPFNLFAVQATTHPCSPLLIVNGPGAAEVGVNARYGAFGPGVRANATIGRAIRLILLNIGGAAPGVLDRATQGQPSKYAFCIAENEAESPWDPLHVERGFEPWMTTVTTVGAENPHNINDHVSDSAAGILATLAGSMGDMGCNNAYLLGGPVLAFGPEHAAIVAADGYDKAAVRRHVFEHARIPTELWLQGGMAPRGPDRLPDGPGRAIIARPEDLIVIVVGGFGRHSSWMPTFGSTTQAVTRAVTSADGAPVRALSALHVR